ncbi:MAG: bifunctional phosphoglucose/phosphomannose isomerase [Nanoarchaeota archaeon]|nr:bifunctional phosphoglucose/phosphomannose isomerase [Nanoarchaeota archaeon]
MKTAIENFAEQFLFKPEIENADSFASSRKFVVVGMGGSHLAAGLLRVWNPYLDIIIHRDYGLPARSDEELKERLIILSSYSGNTEEVLDAFEQAEEKGLSCAVITTGGKLLGLAKKKKIPYVVLPETGIQPRSALGFSFKAFLKLMGEEEALQEAGELAKTLHPKTFEGTGKKLAEELKNKIPVIYSSTRNEPVAYIWKIKFNETGKIPAFCNAIPELNHNEMTGFDVKDSSKHLSKQFAFMLLRDKSDHPRIGKRMDALEELYKERGLPARTIELKGSSTFEKIFSSLLLADWTALYTAELYGLESEGVPMVEEFKELMKK